MIRRLAFSFLLCLCAAHCAQAAAAPALHRKIAGEWRSVVVKPGDTLGSIAQEFGFDARLLQRLNELDDPDTLFPGDTLTLDTRRIVPDLTDNGIVLDIAAGMLYRFEGGRMTARFPAGYGSPARPTPTGEFSVLLAESRPEWSYPPSLRDEREHEALAWRRKALPEPPDTLGPGWVQLSRWGLGIHASPFAEDAGEHKGQYQVRLSAPDLETLLRTTRTGTRVVAFYAPLRLAVTSDGNLWLESHKDLYGEGTPTAEQVLAALEAAAPGAADPEKVRPAMELELGTPLLIGRATGKLPPKNGGVGESLSDARAELRCMDCPPGALRRVTLRLEAFAPLKLEGEFPFEVRDEAGRVVRQPRLSREARRLMRPGDTRYFVWECSDAEGLPLPPGSYTVLALFQTQEGRPASVSLPIWLGK